MADTGSAHSFVRQSTSRFRRDLRESPDPARAAQEKRYLKSPFQFIGVPIPENRVDHKGLPEGAPGHRHGRALGHVRGLSGDVHEERALAIFLLDEFGGLLDLTDMPALERMFAVRELGSGRRIAVHLVGAVLRGTSAPWSPSGDGPRTTASGSGAPPSSRSSSSSARAPATGRSFIRWPAT